MSVPPDSRFSIRVSAALVAAGLIVVAIAWLVFRPGGGPEPVRETGVSRDAVPAVPPGNADALAAAANRFRNRLAEPAARQTLAELRSLLAAMPRDEAVAWIESYLSSGRDQATGLEFDLGPGGAMSGWPSLRVFLLDQLLAINPAAAARISREILTKPTTADEWALALRNVGRVEQGDETNAFLRERAESLIRNPVWQAKPSVGYLNAFDVLVHTRATASTPLLSDLVQMKDRRDLAHAAFLTLDRLVQREPVAELGLLAADRALHQSRPEMTAQQFARADLRDPAQQAVVKSWLLDPARTPVELQSFAGVYPNNNRFVSNNLLTADSSPAGAELAAHDRLVLEIVNGWLADPAFQPRTDTLRTMAGRLQQFTERKPEALGTGDR